MKKQHIAALILVIMVCGAGFFILNAGSDVKGKLLPFLSWLSDKNKPAIESSADRMPSPLFVFSPRNGEPTAFHFESNADVKIAFGSFSMDSAKGKLAEKNAASQMTDLKVLSSGNLHLKYFSGKSMGSSYKVAGRIEDLKYTINGVPPFYEKAVTYPFVFEMSPSGHLSDFIFKNGIPEQAQNVVKNILYAMQTIGPDEGTSSWLTRETDMTGKFVAQYQVADTKKQADTLLLEKRKNKYLLVHAAQSDLNSMLAGSSVRVDESTIKIRVPEKGAWILSTSQQETTTMLSRGTEIGNSTLTFTAKRTDEKIKEPFPDDFGKVLSSLSSQDWFREKYSITDPLLNKLSENVDLDKALSVFREMRAEGDTAKRLQAEKFMVNYLRLNPMASYDLINLLDKDPGRVRFDHESQLILWRLITQAGHKDAQMAVLSAISDKGYSDLTHMRAMANIHSFEYPEDFLPKGLWDYYHSIDLVSQTEREAELKTMALYAIGALGCDEKQNDAIKPEIGQSLVDHLEQTVDPDQMIINLEAIGNYGGTDVVGDLDPYFNNENESVRMAAFHSLRRMTGALAVETLSTYYEKELSEKVRTAALKTLAKMPPSPESIQWAGNEIMSVSEKEGQEALATVLGKNLPDYPESEKILREFLEKDPLNRVKKTVYRFIKP